MIVARTFLLFALLLPQATVHASCLSWLFTPADELIIVGKGNRDRIHQFTPGERVSVKLKNKALDGFVVSNSINELLVIDDAQKMIRIPTKNILSLESVASNSKFPMQKELEELTRLHQVRKAVAELNPVLVWQRVQPKVGVEIARLRQMSPPEQRAYLKKSGQAIIEQIQKSTGSENLGFHYNLHGGELQGFSEGGGIFISRGDIQLNHGGGDLANKVYFFQSKNISLFDILNEGNPNVIGSQGRMGYSLVLFKADSPYFKRAIAEKGVTSISPISYDFSEEWVSKQLMSRINGRAIGIPATEYLAPPSMVFTHVKKRMGMGSLSRNEETLATMRYLEDIWTHENQLLK